MQRHETQKNKGGRPKLSQSDLRKHNLTVRLNDCELLSLHQRSSQVEMTYSRFLREAGLSRKLPTPIPQINLSTHQQLGRLGNNLNQFLKLLYECRADDEIQEVVDLVKDLFELIQVVRKEVIGNNR